MPSDPTYHLRSVQLPSLSGRMLQGVVRLLESPVNGPIIRQMFRALHITAFRSQTLDTAPTFLPRLAASSRSAPGTTQPTPAVPERKIETPGYQFTTIHDYIHAYQAGMTTPEHVAERTLRAIKDSDQTSPPLRAFIAVHEAAIMEMAQTSTKRIQQNSARSLLEGVPIAVKDEIDMRPYPTTAGTSFLNQETVAEDATIVARLRAAGALLLGKTNMHEVGIGITGHNPHHGTPRNPYNVAHHTGGSSSGSAAAVAAGLCPVALGTDGGGSTRIPAAFCGLVGLKPTFGRVSGYGTAELAWSTVHVGTLSASAADAALVYQHIAGPDPHDPLSTGQPVDTQECWTPLDFNELTIGIYDAWFQDADSEIVDACERMLDTYAHAGATIRSITIPYLEECRVAHTITIGSEMLTSAQQYYQEHRQEYSLETRANFALISAMTAQDYVKAQQYRTQLIETLHRLFSDVDVIITPATGMLPPAIAERTLSTGTSDSATLMQAMRFAQPANLSGFPAITYPVGYTRDNLPIGMQAMAGAWNEQRLLQIAMATEQLLDRQGPEVYYDALREK